MLMQDEKNAAVATQGGSQRLGRLDKIRSGMGVCSRRANHASVRTMNLRHCAAQMTQRDVLTCRTSQDKEVRKELLYGSNLFEMAVIFRKEWQG